MANLTLHRWGPEPAGPPKRLVFLLHGLGADGRDLIELAPDLAQGLPDTLFLAPDAPDAYDMAPFGRQWFSLRQMDPHLLEQGVRQAAPALEACIEAALAASFTRAFALAGFSQGAMLSLFAAPRLNSPPAAILAYSGALLGGDSLAEEARNRPPTLIAHGEADDIVPVAFSRSAQASLLRAGFPVTTMYEPALGHSISPAGLAAGNRLLRQVFLPDDK